METAQQTAALDPEPAADDNQPAETAQQQTTVVAIVPAGPRYLAPRRKKARHIRRPLPGFVLRVLAVLLVTLFLLLFAVYGVMYVLARGPSPTARRLFVMSVRETSAVRFLADWFCTPEEIAGIEGSGGDGLETGDTDVSLIQVGAFGGQAPDGGAAEGSGLVDEDGDGIILENLSGPGYLGYMMVVLDPARICLGTLPAFGGDGLTLSRMVARYDCIAGINGGGFDDPGGMGDGGVPIGMTVVDGEVLFAEEGVSYSFAGFDGDCILHTGQMTPQEAREKNIRFGCSFGPVLVSNGEPVSSSVLLSGVNPRTAIGQRADGAVLLLVIEGRQARSIGATFEDLSDIMLRYGAVNAYNLDGGSSSNMWFDGEYIGNSASLIGDRAIPTAFLVKKEARE